MVVRNTNLAEVERERARLERDWRQVIVDALLVEVGNPATAERLASVVVEALARHTTELKHD